MIFEYSMEVTVHLRSLSHPEDKPYFCISAHLANLPVLPT